MFTQDNNRPATEPFNASADASDKEPQRRYQPEDYGPWTPKDVRDAGIVNPACTMPMF